MSSDNYSEEKWTGFGTQSLQKFQQRTQSLFFENIRKIKTASNTLANDFVFARSAETLVPLRSLQKKHPSVERKGASFSCLFLTKRGR